MKGTIKKWFNFSDNSGFFNFLLNFYLFLIYCQLLIFMIQFPWLRDFPTSTSPNTVFPTL